MDTRTIAPLYLERFGRVQEAMGRTMGRTVSVSGLIEEVLSTYLYTAETELGIMPRMLPVVELAGKRYYRDDRLGELRNVENPHDRIAMS